MDNHLLELDVEVIPAVGLKNITMIEFRDINTMRGGRVNVRREGVKLLVEFIDLEPGVEPVKAVSDPVEAHNILTIIEYAIEWIEKMKKFSPSLVENTKPITFDGLPILKKLAKQIRLEVGDDELY